MKTDDITLHQSARNPRSRIGNSKSEIDNPRLEIGGFESPRSQRPIRRGMTLVEMLIVVGIMLFLAALCVPRLTPIMNHANIRNTARAIQTYINTARNHAIALGRDCGVQLLPLTTDSGTCMQINQVETPVPYGGDFSGSLATATFTGMNGTLAGCNVNFFIMSNGKQSPTPLSIPLHAGDQIQIGYQGYNMLVAADTAAGATSVACSLDTSQGAAPNWSNQPVSGPYTITRMPIPSATGAMKLISTVVVDLTCSGPDPAGQNGSPTWPLSTPTPITIMFTPNGKVDWVATSANPDGLPSTTPLYLLVGLHSEVDNPPDAGSNLNDFNSMWVCINSGSGTIVCSGMGSTSVGTQNISQTRALARQASSTGGT